MCFKSTVYPWGMEQLEHGLRGNCLFHWPAAKGEEVNGKRYESVCPLRWWIRFKLEEEAFQSAALWLFHSYHLKLFSVFCSAAHSRCPHFFLIFLSPVLPFFWHSPRAALQQGSGAVWVDRLSSRRSRGQGQLLQIVRQKAETAWPSVRTQCTAGIARPCRVTENPDLEPCL